VGKSKAKMSRGVPTINKIIAVRFGIIHIF
jgi:hypothetical protein